MAERTCSVEGCERPLRARGLCSTHYNQRHQPNRHRKVEVACGYCGQQTLKAPGSKYAERFCSLICRDATRVAMAAQRRAREHRQRAAWKLRKAQRGTTGTATWTAGLCAECGTSFVFNQPHTVTCSRSCHRRMLRRRGKAARRARIYGQPYEVVDPRKVYERDGWRCGLCNRLTSRRQAVPHLLAPTLDHVIPISKGGAHTYANVQCAHYSCNVIENDGSTRPERLRLIG